MENEQHTAEEPMGDWRNKAKKSKSY
jgi:hypothetical protein